MKIEALQQQNRQQNFTGLIPQSQLRSLAQANTPQARKLLNTCLGFNAVYRGAQEVNPDTIARQIADKFHVNCDFGNNPLVACFTALTTNIFHKLGFTQPTNVILRNLSKTRNYKNALGICAVHPYDGDIYQTFRETYPLRTVVMNAATDWGSIQTDMIRMKNNNHMSTNHFLAAFIHEFMHSLHSDNLTKRFGTSSSIMANMQKEFKNKNTIFMLQKETSNYGATSPCEMFAEEMTELVVDSLNPKTIMPDKLLFKMNRMKECPEMDRLLDACWNGDMKTIENFRKQKIRFLGL
ncbi:MAG: hypothetical protein NC191_08570 [Muribaculaceae bacterium]|nr:hypothetical protein [Muribaculaceae bacterium]